MKINSTKTFLPLLSNYIKYLNKIWLNNVLTNNGRYLHELEKKLKIFTGTNNLLVVNNGFSALSIALSSLKFSNEIITTPFTYIATSSALLWRNCKPIFVDIDNETFCINPDLIEAKITKNTKGILATHVFGNICNLEKINTISKKYKMPIIYDGAHVFGVNLKSGKNLYEYGDATILSFHATKVFSTVEGGAVIFRNRKLFEKSKSIRSYGHDGEYNFNAIGINAKLSELHASFGLAQLKIFKKSIASRKKVNDLYKKNLIELERSGKIFYQKISESITYNYSYFPVVFQSEKDLKLILKLLNEKNIYPKRYFYPSLNTLRIINSKEKCYVSERISKRILCLPIYTTLSDSYVNKISKIIIKNL